MSQQWDDGAQVAAQAEQLILNATRRAVEKCLRSQDGLQKKLEHEQQRSQKLEKENERLQSENVALKRQLQSEIAAGRVVVPPKAKELKLKGVTLCHSAQVHGVAIKNTEHGGTLMASASWDRTVLFYDLNHLKSASEPWATFGDINDPACMGPLYSVAFAKDHESTHIFGCSSVDTNVYLWDWTLGNKVGTLRGHSKEVNDIDFHPDQQILVSASDDHTAIIWDFAQNIELRRLDQHQDAVYGANFLGMDHQYLVATCCFDRLGRIFDMRTRDVVQKLSGHTDDVVGLAFSPARGLLATGSDDGSIILWHSGSGWRKYFTIETRAWAPKQQVKKVCFSPDGQYLAAAGSTGVVLVYDMDMLTEPSVLLTGHTKAVFDLTWGRNLDGQSILASASHDQTCRIWTDRGLEP